MIDKPTTLVRVIVEPNGPGGCDGPPIPLGVHDVIRVRQDAPTIVKTFDPIRADLLDGDFDLWTDEEIAALTDGAA